MPHADPDQLLRGSRQAVQTTKKKMLSRISISKEKTDRENIPHAVWMISLLCRKSKGGIMGRYPGWVTQFKRPGLSFKRSGNQYYAYRRVPKTVNGVTKIHEEYVGPVTPAGVLEKKPLCPDTVNGRVYEYGFSVAVRQLCPLIWKNRIRDDWNAVLDRIIIQLSPNSYLLRDDRKLPDTKHYAAMQMNALERMLPATFADLYERLGGVMIAYPEEGQGGNPVVYADSAAREYAASLGISFTES